MRKYILIFILLAFQSNAQYNLFARQNFAKSVSAPTFNTYIGGVSATLGTAALLATKLGISVGAISNFTVVGSDIKCKITGGYAIPANAFISDTNITYYNDTDELITTMSNNTFDGAINFSSFQMEGVTTITGIRNFQNTNLDLLYFPNLTSTGTITFNEIILNKSKRVLIYIPNCSTLGVNVTANESVFLGLTSGSNLYLKPSLETINSGGEEGDVAYARSIGCNIRYVTNLTSPTSITDLSVGNVYATAIQLNFTPPVGSTNAIDFYECYANGVYKNTITGSGGYVTGLTPNTSYDIFVKPVDVFYNKSTSNVISQTTNSVEDIPMTGLTAYYKLDETSGTIANDAFRANNLTNTGSVSINQSGKLGASYAVTSANKYVKGNYTPSIYKNFSINFWIYRTGTPTTDNAVVIQAGSYVTNTGFGVWMNLSNQLTWVINQNYDHYSALLAISLNTWTMVTMTYDGANVKMYLDSVLKTTTSQTTNPNVSTFLQMFDDLSGRNPLCRIDEASYYYISLSQTQIDSLYNSGTGITL